MIRLAFVWACVLMSNMLYAQCDITNGLVHRYELNGNANDMVGTNHATFLLGSYGAYTTDRFGKPASALKVTNGLASIALGSPYFWFPGDNLTITMWVSIEILGTQSGVYCTNSTSNISLAGFNNNTNTAAADGSFYAVNASLANVFHPTHSVVAKEWNHVAFVVKGDSTYIYMNGQFLVKTAKPTTFTSFNSLIGRNAGQPWCRLGTYDDIRIYNRDLSQSECFQLYQLTNRPIQKQPMGISICPEGDNTLRVSSLPGYSYQWFKNNIAISGANDSAYTIQSPTITDSGNYKVVVYNLCKSDTSNTVFVTYGGFVYSTGLTHHVPFTSGYGILSPVNASTGINGNGAYGGNRFGTLATAVSVTSKLSYFTLTTPFNDASSTMSVWCKFDDTTLWNGSTPSNSIIFGSSSMSGALPDRANLLINTSGQLGYTNPTSQFVGTGIVLSDAQWYLLTVVRNGINYKLYINGKKVYEANNVFLVSDKPVYSLGGNGGTNMSALGTFDELRFYNYPLNDGQVYNLFSEVVFPTQSSIGNCDSTTLNISKSFYSSDTTMPVIYEWYRNNVKITDNGRITGSSTNSINFNPFITADAGNYQFVVIKNCVSHLANFSISSTSALASAVQFQIIQPICVSQNASIAYSITGGNVNPTLHISGPGITGLQTLTNPITSLIAGHYILYIRNAAGNCTTKVYKEILPPLNGNLIASYNNPVYSGDTLKFTSNAANYINTSSTNGWTGPGGSGVGANLNIPNANTAMNGVYTVTATNNSACTITATINVIITPAVTLAARVFLSGPYSTTTLLMYDSLRVKGLIPLTEPYSSLPYSSFFTHVTGGGETTTASILNIIGNNAIVDWIFVELRDKNNATNVLATKAALLQRDGDIVDARNGTLPISFPGMASDNYFVCVKHRNHLGIMSKFTSALSESSVSLDLTNPSIPLYRRTNVATSNNFVYNATQDSCSRLLGTAPNKVRALYAGNANVLTSGSPAPYKFVRYNGSNNDRLTLLSLTGSTGTIIGYLKEDINMNGEVRYNGTGNDRLSLLQNIGANTNTTLYEQTPY